MNDRIRIAVAGPEIQERLLIEMQEFNSDIAIVAICDTHISHVDGIDSSVLVSRHTYFIRDLPLPYDANRVSGWCDKCSDAVSSLFAGSGVTIRAVDYRSQAVRVQVLWGENRVKPAFAEIICKRMLGL